MWNETGKQIKSKSVFLTFLLWLLVPTPSHFGKTERLKMFIYRERIKIRKQIERDFLLHRQLPGKDRNIEEG